MDEVLSPHALSAMSTRAAALSVGNCALAVRFRVGGGVVECRVPTWSEVGDLLSQGPSEATLVAVVEEGPHLRWLFLRGMAALVPHPDWDGLLPPMDDRILPEDLYQLVRLEPRRMERVDERRGWGFRETADL